MQFLLIGLTLPGTLELFVLTIAALLYKSRFPSEQPEGPLPRLAVVMPAHNEADGIAACVTTMQASLDKTRSCKLFVVADNCQDDTAAIAKQAGAKVLVRQNDEKRGKGYALDYAFTALLQEPFDGFVIVDADSQVDGDFISAFQKAFAQGEKALQCRYRVGNPDASPRSRLQHVAWLAFNELRLAGRDQLNLSVGILGNGFALSRAVLEAVPYSAGSIAEDLEYHLRLVKAGFSVRYLDSVTVRADAPNQDANAAVQRSRWEGGRFRLIGEHVPSLFVEVMRGQIRLLEPLAELLLLPLAYHVLLLLLTLFMPFPAVRLYAFGALSLVFAHVLTAIFVGGGGIRDIKALLSVPFYILWKLALMPKLFRHSRRETQWQRTGRE